MSQNSRKSSRRLEMCAEAGIPMEICAENISAPVVAAPVVLLPSLAWGTGGDWQEGAAALVAIDASPRVRKKLELDPSRPTIIRTVRGEGYLFDPTASGR